MKKFLLLIIVSAVVLAGCSHAAEKTAGDSGDDSKKVTVYKSPTCGCCTQYSAYLEEKGYDVNLVTTQNMQMIKDKYNIPRSMESCHTAVFGDYFVEGHIPLESVEKMLAEKSDIDGIALPGMPAGSPGMPGVKTAPFKIFALTGGQASPYLEE